MAFEMMIGQTESHRIEFKSQLTDNLEKEAVAFLNYRDGGVIYIGVNDSGEEVGIDDVDGLQLIIKDRIKHNRKWSNSWLN